MIVTWLNSVISESQFLVATAEWIEDLPPSLQYLIIFPPIMISFVVPGLFGGIAVVIFSSQALPRHWRRRWRLLASLTVGTLFTWLFSVWMAALRNGYAAAFNPKLVPIPLVLDLLLLLGVGALVGQAIWWYWKKRAHYWNVLILDLIALVFWIVFILALFTHLQHWCYLRTWEPIMTTTAHIRNLCLDSVDTSQCPKNITEVQAFRPDYFEFMKQCQVTVEYTWDGEQKFVNWQAELPNKILYKTQEKNRIERTK